jgi:hypothetical protein
MSVLYPKISELMKNRKIMEEITSYVSFEIYDEYRICSKCALQF